MANPLMTDVPVGEFHLERFHFHNQHAISCSQTKSFRVTAEWDHQLEAIVVRLFGELLGR